MKQAWSQVKAELRGVAARDEDALHWTLGPALDRVPPRERPGLTSATAATAYKLTVCWCGAAGAAAIARGRRRARARRRGGGGR